MAAGPSKTYTADAGGKARIGVGFGPWNVGEYAENNLTHMGSFDHCHPDSKSYEDRGSYGRAGSGVVDRNSDSFAYPRLGLRETASSASSSICTPRDWHPTSGTCALRWYWGVVMDLTEGERVISERVIVVTGFLCNNFRDVLVVVALHHRIGLAVRRGSTGLMASRLLIDLRHCHVQNMSVWKTAGDIVSVGNVPDHPWATHIVARRHIRTTCDVYRCDGNWRGVVPRDRKRITKGEIK